MGKFVNLGDSIEGLSLLIFTRKVVAQAPIKKEGLGILFKYRCQINANAKIIKELDIKECLFKKGCNLNVDDSIEADKIELYSLNQIYFGKQANYSSTHGIQRADTNCFTHANITIPFRFVLERPQIRQ